MAKSLITDKHRLWNVGNVMNVRMWEMNVVNVGNEGMNVRMLRTVVK